MSAVTRIVRLIAKARRYPMTPAEQHDQRIGFAHGNVSMHNPAVTREAVIRAARALDGDEAQRSER